MSTQQAPSKGITTPGRPIKRKGDPMICDCTFEQLKVIPATKPHPIGVPLQYRLNAPKCPDDKKATLYKQVVKKNYFDLQMQNVFGEWLTVAYNIAPFCDSCFSFMVAHQEYEGCDHQQYCRKCLPAFLSV